MAIINGDADNNTLDGTADADTINGLAGNDTLRGLANDDTLNGGTEFDTADYSQDAANGGAGGVDVDLAAGTATDGFGDTDTLIDIEAVIGTAADDTIRGNGGNNTLTGGDGDDLLAGRAGDDTLNGGTGTNRFVGGPGDDTLIGGTRGLSADFNLALYGTMQGVTAAIVVVLQGGLGSGLSSVTGDASVGTDTLFDIEAISGSDFDDTFVVSSTFVGQSTAYGSGELKVFNEIRPGAGDDAITGNGLTRLSYVDRAAAVDANIATGQATSRFVADAAIVGTDTFTGVNSLRGSDFADVLTGSDASNENFHGQSGDDLIDGGDGAGDRAFYGNSPTGVTVDLALGTAQDGFGDTDTLNNIEAVQGSNFADDITGDTADNRLQGSDGDDILRGGDGNDELQGGAGDDDLQGQGGDGDVVNYDRDATTDDINGVLGVAGVTVDLGAGTATDGYGDTDTLSGIENVRGTDSADSIAGDANDNVLRGQGGDDTLIGGGGDNTLIGGVDDDTFTYQRLGGASTVADFGSRYFTATINGAQEVGPNNSQAYGSAFLVLNDAQTRLTIDISIVGLDLGGETGDVNDNVTAAHIHRGAVGVNGPIVFGFIGPNNDANGDLAIDSATGPLSLQGGITSAWDTAEGNATTLTAELANLIAGDLYINVHTPPFGGGEIRGQITALDTGDDVVDLTALNIGEFETLQQLTADDGSGNARITTTLNGVATQMTLTGVAPGSLQAADFTFGGAGDQVLNGTANVDDLFGGDDVDTLNGLAGDDRLFGEDGNDILNGGDDNDVLDGGAGDDTVNGDDGNDTIIAGAGEGDDGYDGGDGVDTITYASTTAGVTVDLSTGQATGAETGNDTLSGFETVIGGDGDDTLTGSNGIDTLVGGDGNDTLNALGDSSPGDAGDFMLGGVGDDTYHVDDTFDLVDEGGAFPAFIGSAFDSDTILSSAEWFWDVYSVAERMETVDGAAGTGPGEAGNTMVGSIFNNQMIGNDGTNIMFGRGGADTYQGGDGVDWISLSLLGLTDENAYVGVDGVNTIIVEERNSGDFSYDIVFEYEPGKDQVDVTDYGYSSAAEVLALGVDDGSGNSYFPLGDGLDYLFLVDVTTGQMSTDDFLA